MNCMLHPVWTVRDACMCTRERSRAEGALDNFFNANYL